MFLCIILQNPCTAGSVFNLFYLCTLSATLQFYIFCGVPIKKVPPPKEWKSKVEILLMLTSWVYLYFPLLSAFYV